MSSLICEVTFWKPLGYLLHLIWQLSTFFLGLNYLWQANQQVVIITYDKISFVFRDNMDCSSKSSFQLFDWLSSLLAPMWFSRCNTVRSVTVINSRLAGRLLLMNANYSWHLTVCFRSGLSVSQSSEVLSLCLPLWFVIYKCKLLW